MGMIWFVPSLPSGAELCSGIGKLDSLPNKGGADLGIWILQWEQGRTGRESNPKLVVGGGYHHAVAICTVGKGSL